MNDLKTCSKCKRELPANTIYFHKHKNEKDGLQCYCKVCRGGKYSILVKEGYKICSKCKKELPLTDFVLNRSSHNGFRSSCKECDSKARQEFKSRLGIPRTTLYRKLNYEKVSIQNKLWRFNNKERQKINTKKWEIQNREKYLESQRQKTHKRNSLKRKLISSLTKEQWEECKNFFNNKCAYCGKESKKLTQDHIIPISKSGHYTKQNIVPACGACNSGKRDEDLEVWYRQKLFFSEERLSKIYKWMGVKNNIQQIKIL